MWKSFKVIDADAHMHEPKDMWDRYVEGKYKDRVPRSGIHGWYLHGL
jgi:hypothetical protein